MNDAERKEIEKAKQTIRDLLNLAENDAAAELEAENALRFARRLMMRHELTEADLAEGPRDPHELAAEEEYTEGCGISTGGRRLASWESTLSHAVERLVGSVKVFVKKEFRKTAHGTIEYLENGRPDRRIHFFFAGTASDSEMAREIFSEWQLAIAALARMKFGGALRGPGREYAEGFAFALWKKVSEIDREESDLIESEQTSTALVVRRSRELAVAKRSATEEFLASIGYTFRSRRSGGGGGHYDPEARAQGARDGEAAEFRRREPAKRITG